MLLDTPEVTTGWIAQPFDLSDPTDKQFTYKELMGENGLLIAFICNHCPYVVAIAERLAADAKVLQSLGIGVVAINSNDASFVPADSPANMLNFSANYGFEFSYLVDSDQSVAKAYDAVCTPDFFGFNKNGELQYRGRLDDARASTTTTRVPELVNAMQQIAKTGKGPNAQHASMGCSIKWKAT